MGLRVYCQDAGQYLKIFCIFQGFGQGWSISRAGPLNRIDEHIQASMAITGLGRTGSAPYFSLYSFTKSWISGSSKEAK